MAIIWTKEIETGNDLIDSEHKELFAKINAFLEACSQGKGRSEILNTLEFLKSYTATHFDHEENLLKESGYPDYLRHKQLHVLFNQSVDKIEKKFLAEGASVVLVGEINQNIGNWLMAHIKAEDMKFGKFLADKG
ncbi:MAG: bacteriohemerythrin [Eubacteriales bacterium]